MFLDVKIIFTNDELLILIVIIENMFKLFFDSFLSKMPKIPYIKNNNKFKDIF